MATKKKVTEPELCNAEYHNFTCTLISGHHGRHIATGFLGRKICDWAQKMPRKKKPTLNETLSMLAELVAVLDNSRDHNDDYSFHEPLSVREACDKARNFL